MAVAVVVAAGVLRMDGGSPRRNAAGAWARMLAAAAFVAGHFGYTLPKMAHIGDLESVLDGSRKTACAAHAACSPSRWSRQISSGDIADVPAPITAKSRRLAERSTPGAALHRVCAGLNPKHSLRLSRQRSPDDHAGRSSQLLWITSKEYPSGSKISAE